MTSKRNRLSIETALHLLNVKLDCLQDKMADINLSESDDEDADDSIDVFEEETGAGELERDLDAHYDNDYNEDCGINIDLDQELLYGYKYIEFKKIFDFGRFPISNLDAPSGSGSSSQTNQSRGREMNRSLAQRFMSSIEFE